MVVIVVVNDDDDDSDGGDTDDGGGCSGVKQSNFHMSGKPKVQSYGYSTESKTSIQPMTACKIIAQPIRMLGHGTVTAQQELYCN